jgi:hypothetical protein
MIINLKQIRVLDTDNIKLDKINYNFDQLVVNGGGPKGYKGPDGNNGPQGYQGTFGNQGFQGATGFQGTEATSSNTDWDSVPEIGETQTAAGAMATLFSKDYGTDRTSIVIAGYKYIDTFLDTNYHVPQNHSGLPPSKWIINKRPNVASNLRFTSVDVKNSAFDINMDNSNLGNNSGESTLYLGFINSDESQQLSIESQNHVFEDSYAASSSFDIKSDGGNTYNTTTFEDSVTFNSGLRIANTPDTPVDGVAGTNKVAMSYDDDGLVAFKTIGEIGGSVPFGTIISILPSVFSDEDRFVNSQYTDAYEDNNPLKIRMGAGINEYEGWYLCNGQTWKNMDGFSTLVPDLNSFSFMILNNPTTEDMNSQGYIYVVNNEIQLIGGIHTDVQATFNDGTSTYTNQLTTPDSEPTFSSLSNPSSREDLDIKKLPQIIYLKVGDLYWEQQGTGMNLSGDYNSIDYVNYDYAAE